VDGPARLSVGRDLPLAERFGAIGQRQQKEAVMMAETLAASPLRRPGQLIAVAAHWARRLSMLGQPNTRAAEILGWFALPAMWGVHMIIAGTSAGQIQTLGSASAAPEGTSKPTRRPLVVAVALAWNLRSSLSWLSRRPSTALT
jgi:hypothetical protein